MAATKEQLKNLAKARAALKKKRAAKKAPVKRKTTVKRKAPVKRKTVAKRKAPVKRKTATKRTNHVLYVVIRGKKYYWTGADFDTLRSAAKTIGEAAALGVAKKYKNKVAAGAKFYWSGSAKK